MHRFKAIFLKESILITRDRRALFLILVFPVFMLILYSYGVTFDITHVPTAVLDLCRRQQSRDLIQEFSATRYLDVIYYVASYSELERLLLGNKIVLALVVPSDFEAKTKLGQTATIQVIANGSDANTANVALGYQAAVMASYANGLVARQVGMFEPPTVSAQTRLWYNPELKSTYSIAPGVIAVVMMLLGSLLTSTSIVREKESGTIEMLVSTPITSIELVMGKMAPYVVISFLDILLVIAVAHFGLGVPIRGSVLLLMVAAVLYLLCALGFGLLASAMTTTVTLTQIVVLFISMLPSILLSGFVFPISSMPRAVQLVTHVVPARYFIIILRGIFLKGVGLTVLWPEFVFLLVFGSLLMAVAASRFRKTIG